MGEWIMFKEDNIIHLYCRENVDCSVKGMKATKIFLFNTSSKTSNAYIPFIYLKLINNSVNILDHTELSDRMVCE